MHECIKRPLKSRGWAGQWLESIYRHVEGVAAGGSKRGFVQRYVERFIGLPVLHFVLFSGFWCSCNAFEPARPWLSEKAHRQCDGGLSIPPNLAT